MISNQPKSSLPRFQLMEHIYGNYRIRITGSVGWFNIPTASVLPFVGTLDQVIIPNKEKVKSIKLSNLGDILMELDLESGKFACRLPIGMMNHTICDLVVESEEPIPYLDIIGKEFPEAGSVINMGSFMEANVIMPDVFQNDAKMVIELHEFVMQNKTYKHTLIVSYGIMISRYTAVK